MGGKGVNFEKLFLGVFFSFFNNPGWKGRANLRSDLVRVLVPPRLDLGLLKQRLIGLVK